MLKLGRMLRRRVPWQARFAIKFLLTPVPYRVWRHTSLFRHGHMQDPQYAQGVFEKHLGFAGGLRDGAVVVELGPGDSVASALFGFARGASHTYLVDSGPYASIDVDVYRSMAAWIANQGRTPPDLDGAATFADVLAASRATYMTEGVRSLPSIPTGSVDLVWSNGVLQSVPQDELPTFASEIRRMLKPSGVTTHTMDFRDLLGGALNHLRMPDRFWESRAMRATSIYTNRLRCSDLLGTFERAGFTVTDLRPKRWEQLPTKRSAMLPRFRRASDEDLLTYHADVVMRPTRRADGAAADGGSTN